MRDAIVIEDSDNVAIAVHPLKKGDEVTYTYSSGKEEKITVRDDVPLFHKFALRDVPEGHQVTKYGEYIGVATQDISKGQWVHTHNLASSDNLEAAAGGKK